MRMVKEREMEEVMEGIDGGGDGLCRRREQQPLKLNQASA